MCWLAVLLVAVLVQDPIVPAPVVNLRTAYVDAQGDDATARLGSEAAPFRTLAAAVKALGPGNVPTTGFVLLERGDTFTETLPLVSGVSEEKPLVYSSYGVGPRPVVIVDQVMYQFPATKPWSWVMFEDLDFYGRASDPALVVPPAVARETKMQIRMLGASQVNLAFENCRWRYVYLTLEAGPSQNPLSHIRFTRCVMFEAWPVAGEHKSNLFASCIRLTLDRCVFDHGGWVDDWEARGVGLATVFNHNVYMHNCSESRVVGCTFTRASSNGLKLTSDLRRAVVDIVVENNLFVDGEWAIDAGGNNPGVDRFVNPAIRDNVLYDIGRTVWPGIQHGFATGIRVWGWRDGVVENNVMINDADGFLSPNTYFLGFLDCAGVVSIRGNLSTGVNSNVDGIVRISGGPTQRLAFERNIFDVASGSVVAFANPPTGLAWRGNVYQLNPPTPRPAFVTLSPGSKPVDSSVLSALGGEPPITARAVPSPVLPLPFAEFYQRIREQGQVGAWDEGLEAPAVNARVRASLGMKDAA